MLTLNPILLKAARHKVAFQPPAGMDPSAAGGAPPPGADPSMGGGMPPGADPSMMGGAPPPGGDPSGGAGAPVPGANGLTADSLRQIMTEVMQGVQQQGGGPGGGGAGGKSSKPDPMAMAMDIFQIKKMLTYMFNNMGMPMPPDLLDGPHRDPSTGAAVPPGTPGSTSDPNLAASQPPAGGAGAAPPGGGGGAGPASSIAPVAPMAGAFPAGGGGGGAPQQKSSEIQDMRHRAAAVHAILRKRAANAC
jgi:hypothetical protein